MARETQFPTSFTEPESFIVPAKRYIDIKPLHDRGFDIVVGLAPEDVADLTEIAAQQGTREYCANDIAKRWTDIPTAEKQLAKDSGRGVVTLRSREDGKIMAFGWTGRMSDDEKAKLPMCDNTFAERLHEDLRGQHLGRPFAVAIVAASMMVWNAHKIGLESWGSNTAAVRSYLGAGAVLVTTCDSERPTQFNQLGAYYKQVGGQAVLHRKDVRQYMQFPWSF